VLSAAIVSVMPPFLDLEEDIANYLSCFGCILGYMATATHGASIVRYLKHFCCSATNV
jgi:hypothetical protein